MYRLMETAREMYELLQDELSKRVFKARLAFDLEPTMTNAMDLLLLNPDINDREIKEIAGWKDTLTKVTTLKGADLDGKEVTLKVASGTAAGSIKITASAGTKLDVSTLPTFSFNGGRKLQIGDTAHNFNQIRVGANDMHASNLFLGHGVDITTADNAGEVLNYIQYASNLVSSTRGDLGASQNRLDHTLNNLSVMAENIQDAESTI